ncbi:MAG: hypothetical protein ACPG4N_13860 [Gammaproteobacteria bacterium]
MTQPQASGPGRLQNIVLSLIALLLVVLVIQNVKLPVLEPNTGFHAVVLSNGQTLFGRLNGLNRAYPELTDVHLIQRLTDPNSGAVRNVLVRRSGGLHGPVRTKINAANIVIVEPVHPNSRLAGLLEDMKGRNAAVIDAKGDLLEAPNSENQ